MRYITEPAEFYKVNRCELEAFAKWILSNKGFHLSVSDVQDILHEWYVKKMYNLLENYDENIGKFESYLRVSFESWLVKYYFKINRGKEQLVESYDDLPTDFLIRRDESFAEREFWMDFPKLMDYLKSGLNETENDRFVTILDMTVAGNALTDIAKKLNLRIQYVSMIQRKIRQKIHKFYRKTGLF